MEDSTCAILSLPAPLSNQALFAVFDGHGGSQVSLAASLELPRVLVTEVQTLESQSDERSTILERAMHTTMLTLDGILRKAGTSIASKTATPGSKNAFRFMGSTAIVVLVDCGPEAHDSGRPSRLVVANCGDSRAVLCRSGQALALSEDHKPELPEEADRIKQAGGHVAMIGPCYRVDGWGLNLSRALGDFYYKSRTDLPPEQQKVIAVPEVRTLELQEDDEFLVLGCDGIFEMFTSQEVIDIVSRGLKRGHPPAKVAEELVDKCCSSDLQKTRGKGGDNCSAIIVRLK
jgi:serine/threonine protein phosphatase PrpC